MFVYLRENDHIVELSGLTDGDALIATATVTIAIYRKADTTAVALAETPMAPVDGTDGDYRVAVPDDMPHQDAHDLEARIVADDGPGRRMVLYADVVTRRPKA